MTTALTLVLVGAACGAVGVWVLNFAQAILAESFTHALLPGLVLATLLGGGLLAGALLGVVAAYLAILGAVRTPRTSFQTGVSVAVSTLLAGGALLASVGRGLGGSGGGGSGGGGSGEIEHLDELLFGDPLAASGRELLLAIFFAAVVAIALFLFARRFAVLAFDPGAASALGVDVARVSAVALALLAVSVTVAANVAGNLLALALVTGPAYGAAALGRRLGVVTGMAAGAGAVGALAGVLISRWADWPAAASIALVLCLWALIAGAVGVARSSGSPWAWSARSAAADARLG